MKWLKSRNRNHSRSPATESNGSVTSLRRASSNSVSGRTVPSRWTWSSAFGAARR